MREAIMTEFQDEEAAAQRLMQSHDIETVLTDSLRTNDRVIARVTDGIYRQPGSAIRELIINAYDADATWVNVRTDAPEFKSIVVEDDGIGMSPESVVNLLYNIGGSAKRGLRGVELKITSQTDPTRSPGGRPLIGKLGIGIFSVSQLTHNFTIITKQRRDKIKTIVEVKLKQYDEDFSGSDVDYQAGTFRAWREESSDIESHGTTIILTSIRPAARDALSDKQRWSLFDKDVDGFDNARDANFPEYYVGRIKQDSSDSMLLDRIDTHLAQRLPWNEDDDPDGRFQKLVDVVWKGTGNSASFQLDRFFDAYLQMIWNISLSLPLPYVGKALLDETVVDEWAYYYKLSNSPSGSATELTITDQCDCDTTIRMLAGLDSLQHQQWEDLPFDVLFDGIRLKRPIRYRNLPVSSNSIKKPMVFVGSYRQDFEGMDSAITAGPLAFEAYLFWNPKICPTEHRGCLVRIHNSSGTLFDRRFFGYQVAEINRLSQITCEIFVSQGLESALNIDRESFNNAHPHAVILARWVHSALRQLATAQKKLSKQLLDAKRHEQRQETQSQLQMIVTEANEKQTAGAASVPHVQIRRSGGLSSKDLLRREENQSEESEDNITYILPVNSVSHRTTSIGVKRKAEAIVQVLSIYGLLEKLTEQQQRDLVDAILSILEVEADD